VKFIALTATILLSSNTLLAQEQPVDANVKENSGVQLDIEQTTDDETSDTQDDGQEDFTFNIVEREQAPVALPTPAVVQPIQPQRSSRVTLLGGSVSLPPHERNKWVGWTSSVGLPSGPQVGISIRPGFQFIHIDVMANYVLKLGYAASLTFDPIDFPVAPTLTGEFGHITQGNIPSGKGATVGWDYKQILGGLEFGNRRSFRFFLRAGVSWIDVKTHNINNLVNNDDIVIGDPSLHARVGGACKIGFNSFF